MRHLSQEIEAWYIIPAIRREIAHCLIKEHNLSYEKIGSILGISKAAISQYSKGKRAAKIKLPKELNQKIVSSCKTLIKEKSTSQEEISKMIDLIRKKSFVCCIHEKLKEGILEDCKEFRFKDGNYQ